MPSSVVISLLSMGGLGLLLSGGLALASNKLAVETDPRADAIIEVLPGANCGACGFPGCAGLAAAVVGNKAPVNACPVGGEKVAAMVARIMGVDDAGASDNKIVATLMCQGGIDRAKQKAEYQGFQSCRAANLANGGPKGCPYGCIGLADCVKVCAFDAIKIGADGIPVVDEEKCTGCGLCAKECPKFIIEMTSTKNEVHVRCKATLKAKEVRAVCSIGCIACKMCEKACQFDAVHVINNVAVIDYDKCTNCMACVEKCPTKTITSSLQLRKKAVSEAAV